MKTVKADVRRDGKVVGHLVKEVPETWEEMTRDYAKDVIVSRFVAQIVTDDKNDIREKDNPKKLGSKNACYDTLTLYVKDGFKEAQAKLVKIEKMVDKAKQKAARIEYNKFYRGID